MSGWREDIDKSSDLHSINICAGKQWGGWWTWEQEASQQPNVHRIGQWAELSTDAEMVRSFPYLEPAHVDPQIKLCPQRKKAVQMNKK